VAWRTLGRVGGGLLGAAAGAFVIKQLQEKRAQAASVMLHNLLASKADPGSLRRQEVTPATMKTGAASSAAGGKDSGGAGGAVCMLCRSPCKSPAPFSLPSLKVDSPKELSTMAMSQVEEINARFGVDVAAKQTADVARIYGIFLESVIPKGEAPLTGALA